MSIEDYVQQVKKQLGLEHLEEPMLYHVRMLWRQGQSIYNATNRVAEYRRARLRAREGDVITPKEIATAVLDELCEKAVEQMCSNILASLDMGKKLTFRPNAIRYWIDENDKLRAELLEI